MSGPSPTKPSAWPILAGIAYVLLVFALGFLLGTVRTFLVRDASSAGRLLGVLIELPIMLGASWFLCSYVIRRCAVAPTVAARAHSDTSRSFAKPKSGRIAVKVINHLGDEVMKVFKVAS